MTETAGTTKTARLASLFPADASQIILAAGYVAVCWLFLYFLFRQKIFLRV